MNLKLSYYWFDSILSFSKMLINLRPTKWKEEKKIPSYIKASNEANIAENLALLLVFCDENECVARIPIPRIRTQRKFFYRKVKDCYNINVGWILIIRWRGDGTRIVNFWLHRIARYAGRLYDYKYSTRTIFSTRLWNGGKWNVITGMTMCNPCATRIHLHILWKNAIRLRSDNRVCNAANLYEVYG